MSQLGAFVQPKDNLFRSAKTFHFLHVDETLRVQSRLACEKQRPINGFDRKTGDAACALSALLLSMEIRQEAAGDMAPVCLRLNSVHAIRGLAALLILTLHIFFRERRVADSILPHWLEFTRSGTIFFVISGAAWLLTCVLAAGPNPNLRIFYKRRFPLFGSWSASHTLCRSGDLL